MKTVLALTLLTFTYFGNAEIIRSPVHSVEVDDQGQPMFVKFKNGRVAFLDKEKSFGTLDFSAIAQRGELIEAKVDARQNLKALRTLGRERRSKLYLNEASAQTRFEPSVITLTEAREIFQRFNSNYVRASECSNRAHVWAHEEFTKKGTKSMKAFLFFTASYINKHRFKWWFHVAPAFAVKNGDRTENYVFDYMFNDRPVTAQDWKDQFVFTRKDCKTDGTFTEYDQRADQNHDCYMLFRPMYYWMPADLSIEEISNAPKVDFVMSEVRAAYSEAF